VVVNLILIEIVLPIGEMFDEDLEHTHLYLDDNVIRRREISNNLKRKAFVELRERMYY